MFKKGAIIKAKELVGKTNFRISHMATITDNVHSIEWFDAKHSAVIIRYNDNQSVTVDADENYVGLTNDSICYESMVHNFFTDNWRERYANAGRLAVHTWDNTLWEVTSETEEKYNLKNKKFELRSAEKKEVILINE